MLHVAIPPLEIRGERLLHIAADGSLYEAARRRPAPLHACPRSTASCGSTPAALLAAGPGPAWPPLPQEAEPRMLNRVPGSARAAGRP